jgi:hypothetical protein
MTLLLGDCLDVLRTMADNSVDAVLKPGGHLLAFAGTRTQHRMAVRIEDAGFEIRDMIAWVYGSGFPKSLDVSKAIDKAAGAEREVVGQCKRTGKDAGTYGAMAGDNLITAPATTEAQQWAGWGTALKPALEPITMARKPLTGTVAANVLEHGTGGDQCGWVQGGDGRRFAQNERQSNFRWIVRWVGSSVEKRSKRISPQAGSRRRFY